MALTVDELAEILNTIRVENEGNVKNFEKVLTGINTKIEMMAADNEATDLIKVYISELKKSVEEGRGVAADGLSGLQNSLNEIISSQKDFIKIDQMGTLFNSLSENISGYTRELSRQSSVLEDVGERINFVQENTLDSEDLKALFDRMTSELAEISRNTQTSLDNIGRTLFETADNIKKIDTGKQVAEIKSQIENLSSDLKSIPSKISFSNLEERISYFQNIIDSLKAVISDTTAQSTNALTDRFSRLENSFKNIVTESDFTAFRADLANFVQKIIDNSSALNSELSYSTERIENILTTVKSLDFRDDFDNITLRLNDLKEAFEEGYKLNYSNLSFEISGLSEKLDSGFASLDEDRKKEYSDVKNELSGILYNLQNILNSNPQKSLDELSALTGQVLYDVQNLRNGIVSDIQDDYGDVKESINGLIENIRAVKEDFVSQNESSFNLASQKFDFVEKKLEDLTKSLSENGKAETSEIINTLDKVSLDMSELVSTVKDNSNSNYEAVKEYIEELVSTVNNLHSDFSNIADKNSSRIISDIAGISTDMSELRDEFRQVAETDLVNFSGIAGDISAVSSKIENLENVFTDKAQVNFEKLKNILDDLSIKISDDIEKQRELFLNTSWASDEQKLEAIKNLSSNVKNFEDILNSASDNFASEIKANIQELKEFIGEVSNSIYESHNISEEKFTSKLEALEVLNNTFDTFFTKINCGVEKILENLSLLDSTEQNAAIRSELDSILSSYTSLQELVNVQIKKSDELSAIISNLNEIVLKKDDLLTLSDRLEHYGSILPELKELLTDSSNDTKALFEKLEISLMNTVDKESFLVFKNDLTSLLQKISDNSNILNSDSVINREKINEILNKFSNIEPYDYSHDLNTLLSKLDDLTQLFELSSSNNFISLSDKIDEVKNIVVKTNCSEYLTEKLSEFKGLFDSVKELISSSFLASDEKYTLTSEKLLNLEQTFSNVVTGAEFALLRSDVIEFLGKILDNSDEIQINSDIIKDQIIEIFDKIQRFDYSQNFEKINSKLDEVQIAFENNAKNNYENIINEINNLKEEITLELSDKGNIYKEKAAVINDGLSALVGDIAALKDFSTFNSGKIVDNIIDVLNKKTQELSENINSETKINIEDLKFTTSNMLAEIRQISGEFIRKSDTDSLEITTGFDKIKMSVDNLVNLFTSLNDELRNEISQNKTPQELVSNIIDLGSAVEELKLEIQKVSSEYFDRIFTGIHEISGKIDGLSDGVSNDITENLAVLKDSFTLLSEDIHAMHVEYSEQIKSISEIQTFELKNISVNVGSFKNHVNDICENLKNYITELNVASKSAKSLSDSKFSEKLLDIEAAMVNASEIYESKVELLQGKLSEFTKATEDSSVQVQDKVNASIAEIVEVRGELGVISEFLKTSKTSFDENFSQTVAGIDDGINNILESLNGINNYSPDEFSSAVSENIAIIDNKFERLIELTEQLKNSGNDEVMTVLDDKISALKNEIALINTDISDALQCRADEIISAFEPVRNSVEELTNTGFDKITSDLKSLLEASFMNFSVDVNGELATNSESVLRLEQAYKETYNRITAIEDCVCDKIQNDIELLNLTIETNSRNLKSNFEEKLYEYINDLKEQLDLVLNSTKVIDAVENLKDEFSVKLDSLLNDQAFITGKSKSISESLGAIHQKIDVLTSMDVSEEIIGVLNDIGEMAEKRGHDLSSLIETLTEKVDIISSNEELKFQLNEIAAKISSLPDENIISNALKTLSEKIDVIVSDATSEEILNTLKDSFNEINSKIDILSLDSSPDKLKEVLKDGLNDINAKIDVIAQDNTKEEISEILSEVFDTVNSKIDVIASDNSLEDVREMLSESFDAINSKVDVLVSDNTMDEIRTMLSDAFATMNSKIDIIASDTSVDDLHEKFDEFTQTEDKVAQMLSALHEKVDILTLDSSEFNLEDEIDDIKDLIFEQRKYFETTSDEKASAIDKYLRDVLLKLDNVDLEKNSEDIKDSIMNALVSLFDQISFVEESEDIKDFVEEKTDLINQNLIEVQNQLKHIAMSNDDSNYSYTLHDVETDIAKLRLAINNMSGNDFGSLSEDIKKIVNSVEELESTLTQDQAFDLKKDIEKLNEDILSISSRTNKILLTSDESYKALHDGLNNFSSLALKLEDRINYLGNTEISERLEKKLDSIHSMSVESANADKVFHQVMMYLGEWVDSTTENISSILDKTSAINKIKDDIEELRKAIPDKSDILDDIENRFEQQELRIDRLEMKLERILSTLEEKDDMVLNRKVDKIEKMLSRLGTNIEKLTSYVDDEE